MSARRTCTEDASVFSSLAKPGASDTRAPRTLQQERQRSRRAGPFLAALPLVQTTRTPPRVLLMRLAPAPGLPSGLARVLGLLIEFRVPQ
jgi:hypothetical protein